MNDSSDDSSAPTPESGAALTRPVAAQARIDPRLLEILVCPLTKTTLRYDAERNELVSLAAHLAYPIRDGIPIMLPEEARPISN